MLIIPIRICSKQHKGDDKPPLCIMDFGYPGRHAVLRGLRGTCQLCLSPDEDALYLIWATYSPALGLGECQWHGISILHSPYFVWQELPV